MLKGLDDSTEFTGDRTLSLGPTICPDPLIIVCSWASFSALKIREGKASVSDDECHR